MSISSNNYYRNPAPNPAQQYDMPGYPVEGPLEIPRFRLGASSVSGFAALGNPGENAELVLQSKNKLTQDRMDIGQQQSLRPQAYMDQSNDKRDGLASFFAAGSKYKERDAYTQNHISVSGIPGVVHMAVLDANSRPIPHAPFSWGGRAYHCDSDGKFTILERQYFQNTVPPIHISISPYPFIYAVLCVLCSTCVTPYPILDPYPSDQC